jgi:hypothetical protein
MTEFEKQVLEALGGLTEKVGSLDQKVANLDQKVDNLDQKVTNLDQRTEETLLTVKALEHQQQVQAATLHNLEHTIYRIEGVLTSQAETTLRHLKEVK